MTTAAASDRVPLEVRSSKMFFLSTLDNGAAFCYDFSC
jgi:hypothetical protein